MSTPGPAYTIAAEYASDADRAAYEAGEEISFVKYVGLAGDGMAAQVDLRGLGTGYQVPMFFLQARTTCSPRRP